MSKYTKQKKVSIYNIQYFVSEIPSSEDKTILLYVTIYIFNFLFCLLYDDIRLSAYACAYHLWKERIKKKIHLL